MPPPGMPSKPCKTKLHRRKVVVHDAEPKVETKVKSKTPPPPPPSKPSRGSGGAVGTSGSGHAFNRDNWCYHCGMTQVPGMPTGKCKAKPHYGAMGRRSFEMMCRAPEPVRKFQVPTHKPAGIPTAAERKAQRVKAKLAGDPGDDAFIKSLRFLDANEAAKGWIGSFEQERKEQLERMVRSDIAGACYGMYQPAILEKIEKHTPIRGKMHYGILTRVFDRDSVKMREFLDELMLTNDKTGVTRKFVNDEVPGYTDPDKSHSVLGWVWKLLVSESSKKEAATKYPELARYF
jgi:hypothetical protein